MELSEHELTAALRGAALTIVAARRGRTKAADAWERLTRYEQYTLLSSVGDQVLPVLRALPDLDVPAGERPTFSTHEVSAAVAEQIDPSLGRFKRAVLLKARTGLVQAALASLPPRLDWDALSAAEPPTD